MKFVDLLDKNFYCVENYLNFIQTLFQNLQLFHFLE